MKIFGVAQVKLVISYNATFCSQRIIVTNSVNSSVLVHIYELFLYAKSLM